ncbi:MAG TPA: sulfur globule protein precursor [Xanthobacteraceae bacterium]
MLRKTILAGAAALTIGAAALAPSSASASWGGHHGWHGGHGWHHGWFRPGFRVYAGPIYGGCLVRRLVYTPYGPALRWVNVCY